MPARFHIHFMSYGDRVLATATSAAPAGYRVEATNRKPGTELTAGTGRTADRSHALVTRCLR